MAVSDKAPLAAYVEAVAGAVLQAITAVESRHPEWEVGATTITLRAALKPERLPNGKVEVWADVDVGRSEQVSEIPIPLRRKE